VTDTTDDRDASREYASPPCYAQEFPGYFGEQEGAASGGLPTELLRDMAEALVFADTGGVIRAWNPGAEAVFGYSAADAIGRNLDLIIPENLRQAHWRGFERAIAEGATRHGRRAMITRALHATGDKLYVDMSFAVVRDCSGAVIGAVAVARDATERYLEERRLRERLAVLEKGSG
jgi:PAS domain S-box-containing protein